MEWDRLHLGLTLGGALMLAGCGFADIRSPVPEFMRAKAADPPPLETPPNVKQLLSEELDAVFTATSHPAHVRVSQPLHDPRGGLSWTACVRQTAGHPDLPHLHRRRRDLRPPPRRR